MTYLEARIAELEMKVAEFSLIADLAADPDVRERNAQLAEELRNTIECMRLSIAMRLPVPQ